MTASTDMLSPEQALERVGSILPAVEPDADLEHIDAQIDALIVAAGIPREQAIAALQRGFENRPLRSVPLHVSDAGPVTELPVQTALLPGGHVNDSGEYVQVGTDQFAQRVLDLIPADVFYRRESVVGRIREGAFRLVSSTDVRRIIDHTIKLVSWVKGKDGNQALKFHACPQDEGTLVLSAAAARARRLEILSHHPVYVPAPDHPSGIRLVQSGWHADCHAMVLGTPVPIIRDLIEIRALFEELLIDFQFKDRASFCNYIGLLLTAILRPAINGPVPMHMIMSPVERCGKTKLAEEVLGGIILGRPTPALQLAGNDDERDKRIVALLLRATGLVHLDNIGQFLDSPALASLITARVYAGRLLGHSEIVELTNNLTIVATANNPRATGEIVKRSVPIVLQPTQDDPENRSGFRHPDIVQFVQDCRSQLLGALIGLIELWRSHPTPGTRPMGGFERWAIVVGGVLDQGGYRDHRANAEAWNKTADPEGADLRELVQVWSDTYGTRDVKSQALFELAKDNELFDRVWMKPTERAQQTVFGAVLSRHVGRVVRNFRVVKRGTGSRRVYSLEPVEPAAITSAASL